MVEFRTLFLLGYLSLEKEEEKRRLAMELESKRKEDEERERKLAEIERKKIEKEKEIEEKMRRMELEERDSRGKDPVVKQEPEDAWRRPTEDSGSWRKGGPDARAAGRDQPPSRGMSTFSQLTSEYSNGFQVSNAQPKPNQWRLFPF